MCENKKDQVDSKGAYGVNISVHMHACVYMYWDIGMCVYLYTHAHVYQTQNV